jgi:hypothetical protein
VNETGKGFSPSAFGDRFEKEVRDGCSANSPRCLILWSHAIYGQR